MLLPPGDKNWDKVEGMHKLARWDQIARNHSPQCQIRDWNHRINIKYQENALVWLSLTKRDKSL